MNRGLNAKKSYLPLALGTTAFCCFAIAQTSPSTSQDSSGSNADRLRLPEIGPVDDFPFIMPPAAGDRRTIEFDRIHIHGSTIFSEDELDQMAMGLERRPVTVDELLTLRDRLTSRYVDNGFVNSGAVIRKQKIDNGTFTIQIVEGGLSDVDVGDLYALDRSFIVDRIGLATEKPLNVRRLQNRIQLLLADPAIKQINAALGPGQQLGESRLELKVQEAPQNEIKLEFANDRAPSVGAERLSATYRVRNVTGHSDPLTTEIGFAEGLLDFSINYSTPVTPEDVRVFSSASYSESDVVDQPFNNIDVESESWSVALGMSHPIVKTLDDDVSFGMSLERKRSTTFLLGRRFSFSEGVDNGRSDITAWRLTQQWRHRERDEALSLRSTQSFGLGIFGATKNDDDVPDGRFVSWLGQAQYAKRLPWRDWQFALRGDVQLTPDGLLPAERIAIGGATTVRGYRENQLVTDSGWVASAELQIPLLQLDIPGLREGSGDGRLSLVSFIDAGGGWNEETPDPDNDFLLSVGGGLRWQIGRGLSLRLDVGVPLKDVPEPNDKDLQDFGVHFGLSLNFPFSDG